MFSFLFGPYLLDINIEGNVLHYGIVNFMNSSTKPVGIMKVFYSYHKNKQRALKYGFHMIIFRKMSKIYSKAKTGMICFRNYIIIWTSSMSLLSGRGRRTMSVRRQ